MRGDVLAQTNLLDIAPVRAATWSEAEGKVIVERPVPPSRGLYGLRDRLLSFLAPRRLRLDALGAFVWLRLDGRPTVAEIAREVRERFGPQAEPVEERLGLFIRRLRQEGLVAYPGIDGAVPRGRETT